MKNDGKYLLTSSSTTSPIVMDLCSGFIRIKFIEIERTHIDFSGPERWTSQWSLRIQYEKELSKKGEIKKLGEEFFLSLCIFSFPLCQNFSVFVFVCLIVCLTWLPSFVRLITIRSLGLSRRKCYQTTDFFKKLRDSIVLLRKYYN
jgi:hypothetical protein